MTKKILLLVVVVLLTLWAADAVLRRSGVMLAWYNCPAAWHKQRDPHLRRANRFESGLDCRAAVTGDLSWMLGRREKGREVSFVTDGLGFRNPPPPASGWRALLLGDSFGAASVTDQPGTLASRLAAGGLPTYNLSVDGAGLGDELVRLQFYRREEPGIAALQPAIWLIFEGNDLDDTYAAADLAAAEFSPLHALGGRLEGWYKHSPIRQLVKARVETACGAAADVIEKPYLGRSMLFYRHYAKVLRLGPADVAAHPNAAATAARLAAAGRYAREQGLDLRVVFIPTKERIYQWCLEERAPWSAPDAPAAVEDFFAARAREAGLPFLSLTAPLLAAAERLGRADGRALWWLDDTHWNEAGQQVAADEILRALGRAGHR